MIERWPVDAMRSWRGKPWNGVVIGRLLSASTSPGATVAATDIGALGYFSQRTVFDLAGRTDPAIAHGPGRSNADAGARKFDVDATLARRPDVVLTAGPHEASQFGDIMFALRGVDPARDIGPAILSSAAFRADYRETPVPLSPLLDRSAIYVRRDSREREGLARWRMPRAVF
jgi:hypothetical protein